MRVTRTNLRTWLPGALLALLLAVFGVASPVDAAVCGVESERSATSIEVQNAIVQDDAVHSDDATGADHGPVCAHGHCHHGAAAVIPTSLAITDDGPLVGTPDLQGGSAAPPSSSLPLPDQPPRA